MDTTNALLDFVVFWSILPKNIIDNFRLFLLQLKLIRNLIVSFLCEKWLNKKNLTYFFLNKSEAEHMHTLLQLLNIAHASGHANLMSTYAQDNI